MRCYYEELGVARDANDGDIKTAYRKLALRWHPDKNPDCLAEAKERFQLIQQAYEVLSDSHERAWYDNHRDHILRGKNSDYTENSLDVFQYFTVSCFKGYTDDANGFYAVYRGVFSKIAAEDAEFLDDKEELSQIPSFGNSQSNYEEVVGPFYAYWQAYCTRKTYTWLCPYDIQEIKDRRILREIEKEMKKIVQKAKKERNEEVRNLVSFVRKRDRRVQAYRKQLEERAALNRQKQEQNRLEQIRKRQREVAEMRQRNKDDQHHDNADYEEQLKQLEQHYGGDSSVEEEEEDTEGEEDGEAEETVLEGAEEEYFIDDLYCVACNKTFKNERAFANHENSKKHRETVERLKLEMQAEEDTYRENSSDIDENTDEVDDKVDDDELLGSALDEEDLLEATATDTAEIITGVTPSADESDSNVTKKTQATDRKSKKKSRKSGKLNKTQLHTSEHEADDINAGDFLAQAKISDSDTEDWNNTSKKGARKNKIKKQPKKTPETKPTPQQDTLQTEVENEAIKETQTNPVAAATSAPKISMSKVKPRVEENALSSATAHICVTCKTCFASKNKLFAHLKITNHGVYIPKTANPGATLDAKSKKTKGKRK